MNLPTDSELVDAAAGTYDPAAVPFYECDPLSICHIGTSVRIFLTTRTDGLNIIAIEGTHNQPGWMLDFLALGMPSHAMRDRPALGWVHFGFYDATQHVMPKMALVAARGPFAICGHSLGAILALMIGAQLTADGTPPVKIGAFAPPLGGDDKFVSIATSVPFCAYRYRNDPVPKVPLRLPPIWPYRQVPIVQLGVSTHEVAFDDHNIANYVREVKAFEAQQAMAGAA